jgi:hypothetical protein
MPRKPKSAKAAAEVLAPIPAEILDQLVRDGPLTAEEIETASRRVKTALIERALARRADVSPPAGVDPRHSVLRLPARGPSGDRHDGCH